MPATLSTTESQASLVELAQTLVRTGAARPADWDWATPTPSRLIERAVERTLRRFTRRLPDTLPVYAFIRPWSEFLTDFFVDDFENEDRWVLGIGTESSHRVRVGPIIEALGETAAATVINGLMQLTPLCTEGPEELQWIIDGWNDTLAEEGDTSDILRRAESATQLGERIDAVLGLGNLTTYTTLPPGRIRRLLERLSLLSASPPHADDTAWMETRNSDWDYPQPALQLVWDHGCALDHAADEAERITAQEALPTPHGMWILDPHEPEDAARAWNRWVHTLEQISVATRLLNRLDTLIDSDRSSR